MSKFTELWKTAVSTQQMDGYVKRLNISAGIPSEVVDATRAEKGMDNRILDLKAEGKSVKEIAYELGIGEGKVKQAIESNKSVDTSFAGAVPVSLLAEQDLEYTTKTIFVKDGSDHELTIEIHNGSEETAKSVFEGTEMSMISEFENYMGFQIFATPEMADTDGKRIGCFVVIGQDGSLQVFFSVKDARDFIDSVMVTNKATVEETSKDLISMAREAQDGEIDTVDFVRSIKAVQRKRQKATIVAREREEGTKKSFKESWTGISKMEFSSSAIYCVSVIGANGMIVFDRYGLTLEAAKEILETVQESYKGHIIEIKNDMGFREVYAPE